MSQENHLEFQKIGAEYYSETGEENGNPLQYSYMGNPMDRGAQWNTVHGVTKESTRLNTHTHTHTHTHFMTLHIHLI